MKKLLVVFLVFVMFSIVLVPIAKASTLDDIMAKVVSLQKQVAELQSQLTGLALSAVKTVGPSVLLTTKPTLPTTVTPTITPTITNTTTKSLLDGIIHAPTPTPMQICLPTTPAWIQVISPNGGEAYVAGQQITVKWKSCNIPATYSVRIDLNYAPFPPLGSNGWTLTNTLNDGTELVTLPSAIALNGHLGTNFKVNVWRSTVSDLSDNLFTINGSIVSGNVYVADRGNNRIQEFNSSGTFITQWGTQGTGNGQFNQPYSVAVSPSGNVYVGDFNNYRIQEFTSNGTYITQWGISSGPAGIAVAPNGNVYVANFDYSYIQEFTSNGTYITQWGSYGTGNGQFVGPSGIAIGPNGNVYVADRYNNRIQEFTSDGTYITQWGIQGNGNGQFSQPIGIAVAPNGNVYVTDSVNNRIQEFNSSGTFITQWGTQGAGNGQFELPQGVAISTNGNVYVADTYRHRIQEFTSNGTYITQWGDYGSGNGQFQTPYAIAIGS